MTAISYKLLLINHIIFLFGIVLTIESFAQDNSLYKNLIEEANKLYESKDFIRSAYKYSEAFKVASDIVPTQDRILAANSWAQANLLDSAFNQLFIVTRDSNFTDYIWLSMHQPGLNTLHADSRWNIIIEKIKNNFLANGKNLNNLLVNTLDSVYIRDQSFQQQYFETVNKYGNESIEFKEFSNMMRQEYSENLRIVKEILDQHGWLGKEIVGHYGNRALFLAIQHSDLETQEKYLPIMREAVNKGNADPANLALLEDRVAVRQGRMQIYGTQLEYDKEKGELFVLPLEDPDNVDKRRAGIGLEKFEDYLSKHGIRWDVEEYKNSLPGLLQKFKK